MKEFHQTPINVSGKPAIGREVRKVHLKAFSLAPDVFWGRVHHGSGGVPVDYQEYIEVDFRQL